MIDFKRYSVYRDSGIDWLGEVPEHWEVKRLKRVCTLAYGDSLPDDNRNDGLIPVYGSNGIVGFHDESNTLAPSIIVGRKGSYGKLNYSLGKAFAIDTTYYIDDMTTELNVRWLYYALMCLKLDEGSKDSAVPGLAREDAYKHSIPISSLHEQQAIATFLDRETSRIDALIQKKERLLALLKEQRIALISHAVTKGLDPNVPMKDSGIEWLGEVPEHWELKKLRYITTRIQTGCTPSTSVEDYYESGTIEWYGPSSFNDSLYLNEPVKLISQKAIDDGAARLFTKGTIMLIGIGATIGKIAQLANDASCNQQVTAITMKPVTINSDYVTYQLKLLEDTIRGIAPRATLAIFDQNKIADLRIALPPIDEQDYIVNQLRQNVKHNVKLEVEIESSITLLREYRSSLINAAVTGKIDVRDIV